MNVRVHTRHVSISDGFRQTVERKVGNASRIFDSVSVVDVELSEERNPRLAPEKCRVEITAGAVGNTVRVESASDTMENALDMAVDRFEKQLKKLKDRLVSRSRSRSRKTGPTPETPEVVDFDDDLEIVRTKQFVMKPMTAEEAVLQLELLGHNFFLFNNVDTDLTSVVYRRRDGAYGLIEPA